MSIVLVNIVSITRIGKGFGFLRSYPTSGQGHCCYTLCPAVVAGVSSSDLGFSESDTHLLSWLQFDLEKNSIPKRIFIFWTIYGDNK